MEHKIYFTRRQVLILLAAQVGNPLYAASADGGKSVDVQPYFAGVTRAIEALSKLGTPVALADVQRLSMLASQNDSAAVQAAEKILSRYTLANLLIDADGSSRVMLGGAPRTLTEQGWRMFLVRVANAAAWTNSITVGTGSGWTEFGGGPGQMLPGSVSLAQRAYLMDTLNKAPLINNMWLTSQFYETIPITISGFQLESVPLSGIPIEYRVIQLFSRDVGRRSAKLTVYMFDKSGEWPRESGHRQLDFECLPSRTVTFRVLDTDGRGCVASLTIKDMLDHIHPPQAMRLAPDREVLERYYLSEEPRSTI